MFYDLLQNNNSRDYKTNYYPKQASSLTHDIHQRPLTEAVAQVLYYCFEKKMLLEAHSRLKLRFHCQKW